MDSMSKEILIGAAKSPPDVYEMPAEKTWFSEKQSHIISIRRLIHHNLNHPLVIIIEPDDDGFLARTFDLPLYGFGDDPMEAVDNLKFEIESLHKDLQEDDNFTEDWLNIKNFLEKTVE